jgi:2-polyprenyl-3-methyl-5-hydroxy-6-metoxy-1,4-benzoquinol methylase
MYGKMKKKTNHLLEKVVNIISSENKGRVLDLGCGDGRTGKRLFDEGFEVCALDMDEPKFQFKREIPFKAGSLDNPLPYINEEFDYVIFMEVIEHIYNPDFIISEISRILKTGGRLVLSTPNILNLGSRLRFLFEGSYDFFREPTLEYAKHFPEVTQNTHVIPWRYQELEYLLYRNGLSVQGIHTDKKKKELFLIAFLIKPLILLQYKLKNRRVKKKGGIDFARINDILLSPQLFLGRHLILECQKR